MNSANSVSPSKIADKMGQLEKQLVRVWEALGLRERKIRSFSTNSPYFANAWSH